ncbi:hypothetical protein [Prosthecochloris sp. HL-130-GSB]|uniref:hypothetical protein n=1 Tax=Prosthecochloris sp. HL-130-GSB TaxID=1974213 RepID=UPI001E44DDBC|nr:hypothetical protein [Prosthecochloris sp. HL-130-GSB]
MKRDLLNTRTSVIGARRSGVAAALLLREQGAEVFVSEYGDMKACDRAVLDAHGVEWEDGGILHVCSMRHYALSAPEFPLIRR